MILPTGTVISHRFDPSHRLNCSSGPSPNPSQLSGCVSVPCGSHFCQSSLGFTGDSPKLPQTRHDENKRHCNAHQDPYDRHADNIFKCFHRKPLVYHLCGKAHSPKILDNQSFYKNHTQMSLNLSLIAHR